MKARAGWDRPAGVFVCSHRTAGRPLIAARGFPHAPCIQFGAASGGLEKLDAQNRYDRKSAIITWFDGSAIGVRASALTLPQSR